VQQLAKIERRQARIQRIGQRLSKASSSIEDVPQDPKADYQIGQSDKHPQDIGAFLRSRAGDPAVKVYSGIPQSLNPLKSLQGFFPKT
jgi:hypothetical protein